MNKKIFHRGKRGFLFTIATFLMLITLLSFLGGFAERQLSYQNTVSQEVVSYKVAKIWEDVQEDINNLWDINITVTDNLVTISDILPATGDPGEFLEAYGEFIEDYYETEDVDLKFLDPTGNEMDLGDLESKLTINPYGIQYGYPNYGKNKLQVTAPTENVTIIQSVILVFDLTNDTVNDTSWAPVPQSCAGNVCLYFYIEVDSQVLRDAQTPIDKKSVLHIECTKGGPSCVTIEIGETNPQEDGIQNVFEVTMQIGKVANMSTETSLLLNTTDFSINYMAELVANEVNYEVRKEDWM